MLTVKSLRQFGYKVRVLHNMTVNSRGGATVVEITSPINTVSGVALCNHQDQYNRKLGVRIALGRALKQLGMPTK